MKKDSIPYKILIIEDNPGDYILIEDYLLEYIATPIIINAKNFKDAQKLLLDETSNFNVVLLDLSLPDKSGEELIIAIVAITPKTPVIVLTGYTDMSFSVRSMSLGVSDYLLKDDLNAAALHKSIVYNIERKKRAFELAESEKRYSDLFHLSPIPMWVVDLNTFEFLDVNNAAIDHYGYSQKDFLTMKIYDIQPENNNAFLKVSRGENTNNNAIIYQGVFMHKTKDNRVIQVELQSSFIKFKYKDAKLILANDMTEKLNYIQAIEKQNKTFKEIAWIQSHIVRAPVARILAVINLLQNHYQLEDETKLLFDSIGTSANELDQIIREISEKTKLLE